MCKDLDSILKHNEVYVKIFAIMFVLIVVGMLIFSIADVGRQAIVQHRMTEISQY